MNAPMLDLVGGSGTAPERAEQGALADLGCYSPELLAELTNRQLAGLYFETRDMVGTRSDQARLLRQEARRRRLTDADLADVLIGLGR